MLEETLYPDACRIKDLPERARPREYATRVGVEQVPDSVLLALLLRTGAQGVNAVQVAEHLLERYQYSLQELAKAPERELLQERGIGSVTAQMLRAALELGRRLEHESAPERPAVRAPADVLGLLGSDVRRLDGEQFWVLLLDTKNRLLQSPSAISKGVLDASLVHPREVFREAIRNGCASVVLAHNHPSGDPSPSAEDLRITRQLVDAGKILDIRVLDHVIVCHRQCGRDEQFFSMREGGVVTFA